MATTPPTTLPTIEDAIRLALDAHHGQLDKAGQPYILHPLRVMSRVSTTHERMAAVLHDVVEDTPRTLDELRALGYPEAVVAAIDCLSRRTDESYEEYVARARANPIARRVKLADLEDNMDVRRLRCVTEKDRERLERYRRAWSALTEDGSPASGELPPR